MQYIVHMTSVARRFDSLLHHLDLQCDYSVQPAQLNLLEFKWKMLQILETCCKSLRLISISIHCSPAFHHVPSTMSVSGWRKREEKAVKAQVAAAAAPDLRVREPEKLGSPV